MTSLIDRVLSIAGWSAETIRHLAGGSHRAVRYVVLVLLLVSAIPMAFVGSSPRPSDLSFEDMRSGRIPGTTTWGRLEVDLRLTKSAFGV